MALTEAAQTVIDEATAAGFHVHVNDIDIVTIKRTERSRHSELLFNGETERGSKNGLRCWRQIKHKLDSKPQARRRGRKH